jgi:protein arginine N-methyltransferase 1
MSGELKAKLGNLPGRARDRLARSPRAQRLAYALRNRDVFADLYQHDQMLADRIRVETYWQAIEKHVGPGDVVVDLGTGTGVLAMFAAKQGAEVHAIEHGPIVEAARAVAAANGIDNIQFHSVHSSKFELPGGADVLLHEQIGEAAYDERVVENIGDLRDRLLKPGGKILPSKLDLYVEPVELGEGQRVPFVWEQNLHGIDFSAVKQLAQPSHRYLYRVTHPFPFGQLLGDPEPVVKVDLATATAADLPRRIAYQRPAARDGWLDGYCVYLATAFDEEIGFDTSPASPHTHWGAPLLRVSPRQVEAGETISLELDAGDLAAPATWTWR